MHEVINEKREFLKFYYHVSFGLRFFTQISYFQISDSKLKSSCILVVHNDHVVELVNLVTLVYMFTLC
jgi:hypothetical protein